METSVKTKSKNTKGVQCFAKNCFSYMNKESKEQSVSFHKFPDGKRNNDLYLLWVRNYRRDIEPASWSRICSKHFHPSMGNRTTNRAKVREGAVPTIFNIPKHLQVGLNLVNNKYTLHYCSLLRCSLLRMISCTHSLCTYKKIM